MWSSRDGFSPTAGSMEPAQEMIRHDDASVLRKAISHEKMPKKPEVWINWSISLRVTTRSSVIVSDTGRIARIK